MTIHGRERGVKEREAVCHSLLASSCSKLVLMISVERRLYQVIGYADHTAQSQYRERFNGFWKTKYTIWIDDP